MPRSSRHKSSKHSSRDAREYSESEDDLGAKERNGGNEEEGGGVRVLKDSVLSEKRKLDGKESRRDGYDVGNGGEYMEDYGNSSSKRRKERGSGDGESDRWNGGGGNAEEKGDGSRKARGSSESKSSRRREDGIEEIKKSGGRSEKHCRESSRKEGKEKERERDGEKDRDRDRYKERDKERDRDREGEKKGKEGKGEKSIDNEDERLSSKREIATDSKVDLHIRNSEPDDIFQRRNSKRSENSSDKYQDEIDDVKSKHAPSVNEVMKDRRKDEKLRDEKYRDRYRDEKEKSRLDKYKDDYPVKDRSRSRSREKYTRNGKDHADVRQKKMKPRYRDQENDFHSNYEHSRHQDRDEERDGDREHDGYQKRDQVSGRDRDHDRNPMSDKETERDHDYDRERERDNVRDQEPDMGHYDERSGRDNDRRGRTSPDEQDGDSKARGSKALNTDLDKVSLNSSRIKTDGKGNGSRSHSANVDVSLSNRRRVSPTPISYCDDRYRYARPEDLKYRDPQMESRLKANTAEATEKSSKYRSSEKRNKTDDGLMELTSERSATSKPSPMGLTDESPSPSFDRRYMNRSGARRSFDVEDAGRRRGASADTRAVSVADGKSGYDLGVDKPTVEESSLADSSFSNRQAQSNMNPLPPFRPGVESPTFMGMMEEDSRPNSNSRYKRTGDPGMGRGHISSWRGVPSWPSPLPNGFMPFQSGPPPGNFQPIMPHFPSPPIFGFRPMEINQPGMPFPLADTDRFPGHLRPLGWPNMIDPSGPPHLHGWDVNNGVLRGDSHLFGADWEHSRHPINAREWESNVDMWKGDNGSSADLPTVNNKDSTRVQFPAEDGFTGQGIRKSYNENSHEGSEQRGAETRPVLTPPGNEASMPSSEGRNDKKQVSTKVESMENIWNISQFYLSKLDISEELTHPEVYNQCIDLLDGKPGLTVDNDPLALIILTNDRRRGSRAADDALSSYVLPTADDSTFQKALDLYKNKRLEMRDIAMMKIDPLDSMLSTHSNDMNKRDGVPTMNEEKAAPDRDGEEGLQSTILTSNLGKIVDGANTVEDDTVDESAMESVQSNNASPQNVHGSETEVVVEKQENSRTVPVDHSAPQATSPKDETATADQPRVEDAITAPETEMSGKVGSDSVVGDGQSEACEVVSNESELVNYGRIHHHSSENTH